MRERHVRAKGLADTVQALGVVAAGGQPVEAILAAASSGVGGGIEVEDTAALRMWHRTAAGDTVGSTVHATNGHVENAPVSIGILTEGARVRLDTDLTVAHHDGRVEIFRPVTVASGERAYWGNSHGLLIEDFYRHVRAGKHFWIDAPTGLETLRVIQAVYDQCPGLGR